MTPTDRDPATATRALSEVVPEDPLNPDPDRRLDPRWPLAALSDGGWTYIRREGQVREELFHVPEDLLGAARSAILIIGLGAVVTVVIRVWEATMFVSRRIYLKNYAEIMARILSAAIIVAWFVWLGPSVTVWMLVSVGLFWAVGDYAGAVGTGRGHDVEASLPTLADVVVYSAESLNLRVAGVGEMQCGADVTKPKQAATQVHGDFELYVSLEGLVDVATEEKARLNKLKAEKERSLAGARAKLANENFVKGAPANVVQQVRDQVADLESQLKVIDETLRDLEQA